MRPLFKQTLPEGLGPKTVNQYLILIRAVLRYLWKRGKLKAVRLRADGIGVEDARGLVHRAGAGPAARGDVSPRASVVPLLLSHRAPRTAHGGGVRDRASSDPAGAPKLLVDQAVQRGTKKREAKLVSRKNDEAYELDLTADLLAAVDWHVARGYAGPEFLFSKTGSFPRYIDSHVRPLKLVQRKLNLRALSHHKVGRHSVAGQAVTGGESIKAVQAQLGHSSEQSTPKYAHLDSRAQLRLVTALKPARAPHEQPSREAHVNLVSTGSKTASEPASAQK